MSEDTDSHTPSDLLITLDAWGLLLFTQCFVIFFKSMSQNNIKYKKKGSKYGVKKEQNKEHNRTQNMKQNKEQNRGEGGAKKSNEKRNKIWDIITNKTKYLIVECKPHE